MTAFTLAIGDPATGPDQQVTDFEDWSLEWSLDEGCSLSFTTRGNSPAAVLIDELATDVWLYKDSVLWKRLRIVAVDQSWGPDGEDDLGVLSVDYKALLRKANVRSALTYTATSQGTIAWNLIQHAQAAAGGNLGITLGTSGPAVNRTRSYEIGQNIYDAIAELTQVANGMTWDVDELLRLQVSQPSAFPTSAQPCELGVVARSMSRPSSADQFANAIIVLGDQQATTPYQAATPTVGTDPRGRWERVVSLSSVDSATQLQELGDGLLEVAISPMASWTVEMEPTRYFGDAYYTPGTFVTLVQPRSTVYAIGTPAPSVTCQVITARISENADGFIAVTLGLVET